MAGLGGFGGEGCWISPTPSLLAEPSSPRAIMLEEVKSAAGELFGGDLRQAEYVQYIEEIDRWGSHAVYVT